MANKLASKAAQTAFLKSLGFKGTHYQMTRRFQRAYNLGPWLDIDGAFGPATVKAALNVMAHDGRISANFKPQEFACPCNGKYRGCKGVFISRVIIKGLEATRKRYYPTGLRVISGYRCAAYNKEIGGIATSQHVKGLAVDIPEKVHYRLFDQPSVYIRQVGFRRWSGKVCHIDYKAGVNYHEFVDTAGQP